ncbi:hypothetical protein BISA_1889 [Bifidobacterium saguini DSM 23967]|uniref:Uncharacterized protein n=1 Tax=Bifidobacterium saguini DSM 23967 TaxID=1437607 RepID=A0A087D6Y6_9BIFI|nr:hypothetical protein [Bifidobacterium saguini]KFI91286.1 hypothetical protein BISA_1889 [Bifidobacterium saguini DSM 23967]
MTQYRITVTMAKDTDATDAGAWQMSLAWRKSITLDPTATAEEAELRNQAWEGMDAQENPANIWKQVDAIRHREQRRLRTQVKQLIDLLNAPAPALDPNGYRLWDRIMTLSNRQCWQWELASPHSSCLTGIMQAAGIDDWPPEQSIPDITNPIITINLAIND